MWIVGRAFRGLAQWYSQCKGFQSEGSFPVHFLLLKSQMELTVNPFANSSLCTLRVSVEKFNILKYFIVVCNYLSFILGSNGIVSQLNFWKHTVLNDNLTKACQMFQVFYFVLFL